MTLDKLPPPQLAPVRPANSVGRISSTVLLQPPRQEAATKWTQEDVRAALDAHETGDFSRSALLCDAFGRDDRIVGCTRARVAALVGKNGLDFQIAPAKGQGNELAARVEAWWWPAMPDWCLARMLKDVVFMGLALARVEWVRTETEWRPVRIVPWHLSFVRFNHATGRYMARTADTSAEIEVDPADPNWLLLAPGGSESWMTGAVRLLGFLYLMRQYNWRDWARHNERHGLPILGVKEPMGADREAKRDFYRAVNQLGTKAVIRLPQDDQGNGFGLDLIESNNNASSTFGGFREDLDIAIAVALLGQNLSTEVQSGSYAAIKGQMRVRGDITAADAEGMSTGLRDGLVARWGMFNVPGFDAATQAPWPQWNTSEPTDRNEEAETMETGARAVGELRTTGASVDYAAVFERLGIPLVEGADVNSEIRAQPTPPRAPETRLRAVARGELPGVRGTDAADQRYRSGTSAVPQMHASGTAAVPLVRESGTAAEQERYRSGTAAVPQMRGRVTPLVEGQLYVDDLVDDAQARVARERTKLIRELTELVEGAGDYEALRRAVLAHYRAQEPPERLREILEKAIVLAELAGRFSAQEEAEE